MAKPCHHSLGVVPHEVGVIRRPPIAEGPRSQLGRIEGPSVMGETHKGVNNGSSRTRVNHALSWLSPISQLSLMWRKDPCRHIAHRNKDDRVTDGRLGAPVDHPTSCRNRPGAQRNRRAYPALGGRRRASRGLFGDGDGATERDDFRSWLYVLSHEPVGARFHLGNQEPDEAMDAHRASEVRLSRSNRGREHIAATIGETSEMKDGLPAFGNLPRN
jgi:hypothetical protein